MSEQPKKVTGLGGIFFKSAQPDTLKAWYAQHLGLNTNEYGATFDWRHADNKELMGQTIWSPFKESSAYFAPSEKPYMINFRVENLVWLLEELKKEGIEPLDGMQVYEYGKFAHIVDPEGLKIELWQPNEGE
jgi:predicted enzyme related to lactoylglutathione lyase